MEIAQNFMGSLATNTMTRINENGNVVGTIIVNCEGFPETTTLDSLTAATYSTHMRNLSHHASNALKEISSGTRVLTIEIGPTYFEHGIPFMTMAESRREMRATNAVSNNVRTAGLNTIDVTDELLVLRLVTRKSEAVVAPDHEFTLIVVMRRS